MECSKKIIVFVVVLFLTGISYAADESILFTSIAPDALILLDLSGSMNWNPAGGSRIYGASSSCVADTTHCSGANCSGGFCNSSQASCSVDCSRLAIAKRALFDVFDDNDNNVINSSGSNTDDLSLNMRTGYMRFFGCQTSSDERNGTYSYSAGCNTLIKGIGTKYSSIFCGSSNSCSSSSSGSSGIVGEDASGGTPLAAALHEAKLYLDYHKSTDTAAACREKFVILITDGADTYHCSGTGQEDQADQYKRRKATVAKAKALADAGYKVFVVGFGAAMPDSLERTLNWAAYYGKTDNPLVVNSGTTNAITSSVDPCNEGSENDPANAALSGYAFLASNADELATALKQAVNIIREATYAFSLTSVSSARIQSENNLYEASFIPVDEDPFWQGHLKKYNINPDGSLGTVAWDAGDVLANTSAASRNIKTYKSGAVVAFTTANITPADLSPNPSAPISATRRDEIVGYIRGESAYNEDNWKLGDIWHSNPIVITSPSPYFQDRIDSNNAFESYRNSHQRTSGSGRVVVVGANDGQLHVFETAGGVETFSFIPPNLLPRLGNIAHRDHPPSMLHQYYVDGPVSAADVWLGAGSGTSKSASDWRTLVVFGEGRGGTTTLWSSSSSCDSGFSPVYSATYSYYCGYYALDFTDTSNPVYKWRVNPSSTEAPYLADAWSKMPMGRVKINGDERWVGFIGGGGFEYECTGSVPDPGTKGKGFFVIDLKTGDVLWSYTKLNNNEMDKSIPATPAIADTDNDGFIDTAYVGDLGGSMWRFKFCERNTNPCNTSNWSGGLLFRATSGVIRPIYTSASVAKDTDANLWVYWGTGDKQCPTEANAQEKFYALKDNRTSTYNINDLENITTGVFTAQKPGWYINLSGSGEKILGDPLVFGGVVYFTTYTPTQSNNNPCSQSGSGSLYGVKYTTGSGALDGNSRNMQLGAGIPSAPLISLKPGDGTPAADLYVTVSGGAGTNASTQRVPFNPPFVINKTNMLYWKDRRVQ
ncbi:MAG: PilC/PilY family type IV pilus protein [Nitrospirota bacterium]